VSVLEEPVIGPDESMAPGTSTGAPRAAFTPRRIAVQLLVAWFAVLASPLLAHAHAILVRSSPSSRATLGQSPERIDLWFNERLEAAYSTVSVWDAGGVQVDGRNVTVDATDPRQLVVSLPPLRPATYTVRYRVLSVDGHVVEGRFNFTIRGAR
jgi:methionine-rich copper-binding protein CopC